MSAHIDRVREAAGAILAGSALLRHWRAALQGLPEARPLLAVLSSLPSRLPTIHARARRARMSEKSVRRVVLRAIGLATTEILGALRLARVVRRLADLDTPVRTIALQDFSTVAAFDQYFNRYFGCSPSAFRRRRRVRRRGRTDRKTLGRAERTLNLRRIAADRRHRPTRSTGRR